MRRLCEWICRVLSEEAMGFCALLALTAALIPLFFPVSTSAAAGLMAGQWAVVAIFVLEYAASLVLAENKGAYLKQPERLFVAATLLVAFASLLDSVPDAWVAAPSLRVFHVVLAIVFGLRAGAVTVERTLLDSRPDAGAPKLVYVLNPEGNVRESSWVELLRWCEEPTSCWYHVENVPTDDLPEIAHKWKVPLHLLQVCFGEQNYPRVEFCGETILLSVWLRRDETKATDEAPVVLLVNGGAVLSISRVDTNLLHRIETEDADDLTSEMTFATRMVLSVIELAIKSAEKRIDSCESLLRQMERTALGKAKPALFAQAYSIKQELSGLHADFWRLKGVLTRLQEGKIKLAGAGSDFGRLGRHIEFLYTSVDNLREGVISLMDLHMNNASFEMTKFMRLLAVVNVLALIPAVVGGLLGMNILGSPWPLTLPQVTFGTVLANLFCLYFFAIKGWLR